ncbi:hypothetical protein KQH61_04960 [bacterium]|nr:hypothetical protein [bacterium]MCB2179251.1 hypothetical protein [bacterium]
MSAFDRYEEARRILVRAVAELKGGEYPTARRYLERIFTLPATADQKADAHYWLSEISETEGEKREHLHAALTYDLAHHRARKSLALLDGKLNAEEVINPDAFSPTVPEGVTQREGDRFECPTCGSRMVYTPDGESLYCEYCANRQSLRNGEMAEEQAFVLGISTAKGHQKAVATQAFECQACGAVYLLPPETLAFTCPHCDATYALVQAEVRELIPPDGIIPFAIDAETAQTRLQEALRGGKQVLASATPGALTGLYLPAWTFDIGGTLKWTGYVEVQENQTYPVRDSRTVHFDDLFVSACQSQTDLFLACLQTFTAADVQPFAPEYTANWLAESYTITMSDAAVEGRSLAFKRAKAEQRERLRSDRVKNLQFTSDEILIESYKLVLVPVWVGEVVYEGQSYPVLVNGKSGKVHLQHPPGKIAKFIDSLFGN